MKDSKFRYNKFNRQSKVHFEDDSFAISSVYKEEGFNKYLKNLHYQKSFNQDLFDKGIEYYNFGGVLDEAKDEYKNNNSFVSGYMHAKRLALVKVVDEKYNNKSK